MFNTGCSRYLQVFKTTIGLISLDQEKACDRVDHKYIFNVLGVFGLGQVF